MLAVAKAQTSSGVSMHLWRRRTVASRHFAHNISPPARLCAQPQLLMLLATGHLALSVELSTLLPVTEGWTQMRILPDGLSPMVF